MLLEATVTARYGERLVLDGAQLRIHEGEIVALAGESGSGKSTLARCLLRLEGGALRSSIQFNGREIGCLPERGWRAIRGREIALVLQSATAALNPALTLEAQLRLAWRIHAADGWTAGRERALELFDRCALPANTSFLARYPAQISVGQAQRVLIAMALLHRPRLLIADEVTSALDPITARQVLDTLRDAASEATSILFVSHDLAAIRSLCHRVAVLHEGRIVETAETAEFFERPVHPYSQRLVGAMPVPAASIMKV